MTNGASTAGRARKDAITSGQTSDGFQGVSVIRDPRRLNLKANSLRRADATPARLAKGESVLVKFELGGERLLMPARVHHAYDDGDGQRVAELRWNDMVERRR